MKEALLLCLLGLCGSVQAQQPSKTGNAYTSAYAKGSWSVGVHAGYSKGLILENNSTAQLYAGYFIANRLLLGLGASGSQEWFRLVRSQTYTVGPMARYQLSRTRFSPFLTASYQFGGRSLSGSESQTMTSVVNTTGGPLVITGTARIGGTGISRSVGIFSCGAGVSAGISSALRVDLALSYQQWLDQPLVQPQLGINYLIGKKY
ncbi:hypothetical protein [Spirosoma sordidisoli]|uniref:Outer membrane protein beta-barrel domain-containing protein n=1 Tax=Spirosoma sordidisoli TaxID=2502893 RepID=A0A4Q2UP63_9BACT|nr:hypothetical protein [Spirosoma sordidisoli]RYC68609.1 hypothetical protein EQG79_19890 [Spirosoma sordidisoli]